MYLTSYRMLKVKSVLFHMYPDSFVQAMHCLSHGVFIFVFSIQALYHLTTLSPDASSLFQDLQSKIFTVFVPVNSAVNIKVTVVTLVSIA